MKIFLATSFGERDRQRAETVSKSLEAIGVEVVLGEDFDGTRVSDGVRDRIAACDSLIALLTRRSRLENGSWATHPWVIEEATWAEANGVSVLRVVEENVQLLGGIAGDVEKVIFPPDQFEKALARIIRFSARKKTFSSTVVENLPNRDRYVDEIIRQVTEAQRQILILVHTLSPAETNKRVDALQKALATKSQQIDDVRLLAPAGLERSKASYQLNQLGIATRYLPSLDHDDMSFSVFDLKRVVLPIEAGDADETVAAITVRSIKFSGLLKGAFEELWWSKDALAYGDYIRFTAARILQLAPSTEMGGFADRLKIPEVELKKQLPTLIRRECPMFFFIIGRPSSGKTTVARELLEVLYQKGLRAEEIFYFNDYEKLYERFVADTTHRIFEPAEHGGFAVRDYSDPVLETVLKQANFALLAGRHFYKAFVVEFARDAYAPALRNFDKDITACSTVIHVSCDIDTCLARNKKRKRISRDHRSGYVPEKVMLQFYAQEDLSGVVEFLKMRLTTINTDEADEADLPSLIEERCL